MKKRWIVLLTLAIMLVLLLAGTALASPGGAFQILCWTVDGGAISLNTGGGYSMSGTVGQPDAHLWENNGYSLAGGFWGGAGSPLVDGWRVFLPTVLKN